MNFHHLSSTKLGSERDSNTLPTIKYQRASNKKYYKNIQKQKGI